MLKIVTFNVNSLNMRIGHVIDLIKDQSPDVVLLQELKCTDDNFPEVEIVKNGYLSFRNCQKSYNGTAILVKKDHVSAGLSKTYFDEKFADEARYIEIQLNVRGVNIVIASVYVPNGAEVNSHKYEYKLKFLESLSEYLNKLYKRNAYVIVGGDFNVAPYSNDLADYHKYLNAIGFSPKERKAIRALIGSNLFDTYRLIAKNINKQEYSWFDYRSSSFQKNHGMRIDYILSSSNVCKFLDNSYILNKWRAIDKPSDHLPVVAEFNF